MRKHGLTGRVCAMAVVIGIFQVSGGSLASECIAPDDNAIPAIELEEVAGGFVNPVYLAHAGNGDGRLYVVEQAGTIRILEKSEAGQISTHSESFLDITSRVASGGEHGLLSIAFHPQYRDNGYFYVNYTTRKSGELFTRISRFERENDDYVDRRSEKILLEIRQPFANQNGGQLAFGPDGYLYIGIGDNGSSGSSKGHGQNLATLYGALLRIDVDHREDGLPYAIPDDNPYHGIQGARDEIWAYGLRTPWRFSFDTRTGQLYLADRGRERQEINLITGGGNYGWDIMDGDLCNTPFAVQCERRDLMSPIAVHAGPESTSVTGGEVYRGDSIAGLCGVYIYGDSRSGRIFGLRYAGGLVRASGELLNTFFLISAFGEGPDGEIYILDHRSGKLMRIIAAR